MNRAIQQDITLENLAPERVFAILTGAKQFSALSGGAPTEIDASAGAPFSLFGGMIHGRTLETAAGERVVQAWRVKNWEPGTWSLVRFDLSPAGKGTRIRLEHIGFPEGQGAHLDKGWHANYWDPMRKL
jgi:activator of HSP90 ATPase